MGRLGAVLGACAIRASSGEPAAASCLNVATMPVVTAFFLKPVSEFRSPPWVAGVRKWKPDTGEGAFSLPSAIFENRGSIIGIHAQLLRSGIFRRRQPDPLRPDKADILRRCLVHSFMHWSAA